MTSHEYCVIKACQSGKLRLIEAIDPYTSWTFERSKPIREAAQHAQEQVVLYLISRSEKKTIEEDVLVWCAFNGLGHAFDEISQNVPDDQIKRMQSHAQDAYNHTKKGSAHNAPGSVTHEEVMGRFQACLDKRVLLTSVPDGSGVASLPKKF